MSPAINFARRYKGLISVAPEKKKKKKNIFRKIINR